MLCGDVDATANVNKLKPDPSSWFGFIAKALGIGASAVTQRIETTRSKGSKHRELQKLREMLKEND